MDTVITQPSVSRSVAERLFSAVSPETRDLLTFGHRQGWEVAVLGQAPMPIAPLWLGDWLVTPAQLDSSPLPERALERVRSVYAAGLRPKGWVIVHEAPKLLPMPAQDEPGTLQLSALPVQMQGALKTAALALGVVAVGLVVVTGLVVLLAAALAAIAALLAPLALVAGAVAVDPILIAVMEDGTWVEVDRWDVAA